MPLTFNIDIFADIICPWCYIGKKRLEQALQQRPHLHPEIRWRSFLLNPSMPKGGMDRQTYLMTKFGPNADSVYAGIARAGRDATIDFHFSSIERTPNTEAIHKLLIAAGSDSMVLSEYFYRAYFIEGLDISASDVQNQLITKAKLDSIALRQNARKAEQSMHQDAKDSNHFGIHSVPVYIFDGRFSLSGAQTAETFLHIIDATIADTP